MKYPYFKLEVDGVTDEMPGGWKLFLHWSKEVSEAEAVSGYITRGLSFDGRPNIGIYSPTLCILFYDENKVWDSASKQRLMRLPLVPYGNFLIRPSVG